MSFHFTSMYTHTHTHFDSRTYDPSISMCVCVCDLVHTSEPLRVCVCDLVHTSEPLQVCVCVCDLVHTSEPLQVCVCVCGGGDISPNPQVVCVALMLTALMDEQGAGGRNLSALQHHSPCGLQEKPVSYMHAHTHARWLDYLGSDLKGGFDIVFSHM